MQSHESPQATGRGWLALAARDLATARALTDDDIPTSVILHCQQAVEKALKAVIIARGAVPPFVHSIESLVGQLPEDVTPPSVIVDTAEILMESYFESRYDPWGEDPTPDEVSRGLQVASETVDWARTLIG